MAIFRSVFNFYYQEPSFGDYLHIYYGTIYRKFLLYDVTSRDVRKRTVNLP